MPRITKNPYTCPRCGYNTKRKDLMRRHLETLKAPCMPTLSRVVLDDEIKDMIMTERVYTPPALDPIIDARVVAEPHPTTVNINTFNTMNNMISSMDPIDKVTKWNAHNNVEVLDFEEKLDNHFARVVNRLKSDSTGKAPIVFKRGDILEMIHTITKIREDDLSDFNVFYNKNNNRIAFYLGDEWDDNECNKGLTYLIDTLVSSYLDYYEMYLIRKIEHGTMVDKSTVHSSLVEYYTFTSTFDVKPFVQGKHDSQVMYNSDDDEAAFTDVESHRIVDTYTALYHRCKSGTTQAQRRELHKAVLDIVKNSTKTNILEINKQIMTLLNLDEEFKRVITHGRIGISD